MDSSEVENHEQEEWEKISTDSEFRNSVIREIALREHLSFEDIRTEFVTNIVFFLDDRYVIKLYSTQHIKEFEVEKVILGKQSKRLGIPIPELVTAGIFETKVKWFYLVMEYIPGKPLPSVRKSIKKENLRDIISHLGHILQQFHHSDVSLIRDIERVGEDWEELCQSRIAEFLEKVQRVENLSQHAIEEVQDFIHSDADEYLKGPGVLVHADLTGDHVLLSERNGRWEISGLIDVADAMIAPCQYDWTDLWFWTLERDVEGMQSFLATYDPSSAIDSEFRRRCLTFFLYSWNAAGWLQHFLSESGSPPIRSLQELQDLFWPESLERKSRH